MCRAHNCNNNNNINNNNLISIAPYSLNFKRQVGSAFDKSLTEQNSFNSGLKTDRETLIRTVCGSEFQTDSAENWKSRLDKSVLMSGWSSSGMADERKVWLQAISLA